MKSSFAAIFRANSAALRSVFIGVFALFIFSFVLAQSAQPVALTATKTADTNDGYNIIGNNRAGIGFTNGANNDQVGGSTTQINPQLFPLGFYDGGTPARRPMSNSPATAPCGTFFSSFGMVIPANAPNGGVIGSASPYPWNISASGLAGTVTKVTVTINHLNHGNPFDIDMMLIGPGGQNAVIMSDVGANLRVSDVTLTLDDAAAAALPTDDFLVDGTFRPTNYDPGGGNIFDDYFPGSPVPFPSGASALSVFNGTNPNGTWSLYVHDDGNGAGSTGIVQGKWSLSITTTNCSAPVANNDSYTAVEDGTLNVPAAGVLSNDTDPDFNSLTATLISAPSNAASFTLNANGSFSYTPSANFNGTDSFTYKASDGSLQSNTATVTLTVTEVNDPPIASNDSKRTPVNTALVFPAADLTANDSPGPANESGQTLTVTSVITTASTHGTVSLNNGSITYQPEANYSGAASFDYQVCDNGTTNGQADPKCGSGTVNIRFTILTVTRADDRNVACNLGDCSLREALNEAGSDGLPDTIIFNIPANSANCVGTNCTITLTSQLAPAADGGNLTKIDGATGANVITLRGSNGTGVTFSMLNLGGGVNLVIDNLNFTNGRAFQGGAILLTNGTLTLINSALYSNTAAFGGAIYNAGTLNLTNVTVSGNTATSSIGGGIYNVNTGTTNAANVTVTKNNANGTNGGGGGTANNGTFNLKNSIIADNSGTNGTPDVTGSYNSQGYNLVGKTDGTNGFTNGVNGDQTGTTAAPLNTQLAPLTNNGGKTLTHALMSNSPAIDKGGSSLLTSDQRGFLRPVDLSSIPNATGGDGSDIGAFEVAGNSGLPSYEGDVQTRPVGDGFVDSDDIQQIRQFSVGNNLPYQSNEFQRADCSPRSTGGDGFVDGDDVQQARRFSVGTDNSQLAGGPSSQSPIAPPAPDSDALTATSGAIDKEQAAPAAFRVDNQNTSAGATLTVPIRVDTVGNEAGYTFSIAFDSTKLTSPTVMIGNGGDVIFNANNPGQIGFSVTSFSGGTIAAGNNIALVNVTFTVAAGATGTSPITFTDAPARRKASGTDPNNPIVQPTYAAGTITIGGATAAGATIGGRVLTADGRGVINASVTLTDKNGTVRTVRTTAFGYYRFEDVGTGQTYIISLKAKRFTFGEGVRTITVSGDLTEIDFTAQEQ